MGTEQVLVLEKERQFYIPSGVGSMIAQSENCAAHVLPYTSVVAYLRIKQKNLQTITYNTNHQYSPIGMSVSKKGFDLRLAGSTGLVYPDEAVLGAGSRWVDSGSAVNVNNANQNMFNGDGLTFMLSTTNPGASLLWYMVNNDSASQSFVGDIVLVCRSY